MRPFERLDEGEKQIVRYQAKQFMKHCRLFHAEVIPSIPNDEDEGELIIEDMPVQSGLIVPLAPKSREKKPGVSRRWTSNIAKKVR
jgi:hypothetical protein